MKNDVKTHKRALKSKILLRLRPRPLSSPLFSYKTPPYFSNSGNSAPPLKFSLATPLIGTDTIEEEQSTKDKAEVSSEADKEIKEEASTDVKND